MGTQTEILMEKRHIFENVGFLFKIDQENESVELLEAARYGPELLDESDIQQMIFMFSNGKPYCFQCHKFVVICAKFQILGIAFDRKIRPLFINVLFALGCHRRYSSVVEHFTRNEGVPSSSLGAAFFLSD